MIHSNTNLNTNLNTSTRNTYFYYKGIGTNIPAGIYTLHELRVLIQNNIKLFSQEINFNINTVEFIKTIGAILI